MRRYAAAYAHVEANFTLQQLPAGNAEPALVPTLCVLANLLHRGVPAPLSRRLQAALHLGYTELRPTSIDLPPLPLISSQAPDWGALVLGDTEADYFPARELLEAWPQLLGETYGFAATLMLPEASINIITGVETEKYAAQRVDFYLPQARLVIEVDGIQLQQSAQQALDVSRDKHLHTHGIKTLRIPTAAWRDAAARAPHVARIQEHLALHEQALAPYRQALQALPDDQTVQHFYLPTAMMRLQTVVVELLRAGVVASGGDYLLSVRTPAEESWHNAHLLQEGVEDILDWFDQLCALRQNPLQPAEPRLWQRPRVQVELVDTFSSAHEPQEVRIDLSVLQRYSSNGLLPEVIYVRTDYLQHDSPYRLQQAQRIDYQLTKAHEPVLEFFLRNLFDKEELRPGQFAIIAATLAGEDAIGLLPTGGGKSLCYQLPCLLQPTSSFVVVPIISLMEDQVRSVRSYGIDRTESLNCAKLDHEKTLITEAYGRGSYHWIYISPERFQIKSFRELFSHVIAGAPPAIGVIDEVHCMSEWGHDFRPSYLNLVRTIYLLSPQTRLLGLTATASVNVLQDLKAEFSHKRANFRDDNIKAQLDLSREELVFDIEQVATVDREERLHEHLQELMGADPSARAAIVFTPHVNGRLGCFQVANRLRNVLGASADYFAGSVPQLFIKFDAPDWDHQGIDEREQVLAEALAEQGLDQALLSVLAPQVESAKSSLGQVQLEPTPVMTSAEYTAHKRQVQTQYLNDELQVIAATKAFGMGIDKSNIDRSFHYGLPASLEALYQEAGRAGRWDRRKFPNRKAVCRVLYAPESDDVSAKLEELWMPDTPVEAGEKALASLKSRQGADVATQLFLHYGTQLPLEHQAEAVEILYRNYGQFFPGRQTTINRGAAWHVFRELIPGYSAKQIEPVQIAIYRLSLLGVVDDWTVEFGWNNIHSFTVAWAANGISRCDEALARHIERYDRSLNVRADLALHEGEDEAARFGRAVRYLIDWTARTITYQRRATLRTLVQWSEEFPQLGSEGFKARIDGYFRINERTYVLQHLFERPEDVARWAEALTLYPTHLRNDGQRGRGIWLFDRQVGNAERRRELDSLRAGLSRFIESTNTNVALNILSGLTWLALGNFDQPDGRARFTFGLAGLRDSHRFSDEARAQAIALVTRVLDAQPTFPPQAAALVLQYFPNYADEYADRYNLLEFACERIAAQRRRLQRELDRILQVDRHREAQRHQLLRRRGELDDQVRASERSLEQLRARLDAVSLALSQLDVSSDANPEPGAGHFADDKHRGAAVGSSHN